MVYAYVPNFVSIGLIWLASSDGENPHILPFFGLWHFCCRQLGQSEKVEHGCTTTNLPLFNGIRIVSVLQRLHGKIGRTICDVQKRDGQTDRQTKNSTFLADPVAGKIRAPPNLAW